MRPNFCQLKAIFNWFIMIGFRSGNDPRIIKISPFFICVLKLSALFSRVKHTTLCTRAASWNEESSLEVLLIGHWLSACCIGLDRWCNRMYQDLEDLMSRLTTASKIYPPIKSLTTIYNSSYLADQNDNCQGQCSRASDQPHHLWINII